MRLVAGAILRQSDVEAIKQGREDPAAAITRLATNELSSLQNDFVRNHVGALAWMVAHQLLDIRIAIITDDEGQALSYSNANQLGIFHQKVGIFHDKLGNMVSFSGSVNETATAWKENVEEFKVFRSWIEAEKSYLQSDQEKFERYWYGDAPGVRVIDVPEAVRKKLIQIAPDSIDKLDLVPEASVKRIVLRTYQSEAIRSWINHNKHGVLEMATGTGKTYTAIACLRESLRETKNLAVIITCPFLHLIDQWNRSLRSLGMSGVGLHGGIHDWPDRLANEVLDLNSGISRRIIVITTHDTFSSEKFRRIISDVRGPMLLIADEVHWLGAPERRLGLLEKYNQRLGLSATPERWLDDEGTSTIMSFFGGTIFEFPLSKAIPDYLVPYRYYPHFVQLEGSELDDYKRMTARIAREYSGKDDSSRKEAFELYCILRQKIVVNAGAKYQALDEILDSVTEINHCLIYCSEQQIDRTSDILNKRGIVQHRFTAHENIEQRDQLLRSFESGNCQVLVAMKVLDEGVDIPDTRTAIIMASSGNPRQYIQRRGRILRKAPGKDRAVIHDVIVVPNLSGYMPKEYQDLEERILKKELLRYKEFAMASQNPAYALNLILPVERRYSIEWRQDARNVQPSTG
jgi:superfamily II DNA or RNA helicase